MSVRPQVNILAAVTLTWGGPPAGPEFDQLILLAERCLAADGGLPLASSAGFLERRWSTAGTLTARADGVLVAAGAVRPSGSGSAFTGLVDPQWRGQGLGSHLLDWALGEAAVSALTVESESVTPATVRLLASRGLRQVFAEDVLRIDLGATADAAPWPAGTVLTTWSDQTSSRFHAVYEAAFRERPGFPGWTAAEWIEGVAEEDDFRPQWSVLASLPELGDTGFVTCLDGWIDQVGVAPAARGQGLGAALVGEALTRMRQAGSTEAWLCVNVDNPAARLYRRLGFKDRGRRARFQQSEAGAS